MGKQNRSFMDCVNDAINGVFRAFLSEKNLRIHFAIGAAVIIMSLVFNISKMEMIAVIFAISLVIAFEMINTAVEKSIDLFTTEYNELARFVKDVSAGAVLVTAVNAIGVGYIVFFDDLMRLPNSIVERASSSDQKILIAVLAAVVIAVFGLKMAVGKGSYIRGGFPSGHSAVAFSLATVITISNEKLLASFFSYVLAFIVAESRVASNIHSRLETIAGAGVGIVITIIIFNLLRM